MKPKPIVLIILIGIVTASVSGCIAPQPESVNYCNASAKDHVRYDKMTSSVAKATGNLLVERNWTNVTVIEVGASFSEIVVHQYGDYSVVASCPLSAEWKGA